MLNRSQLQLNQLDPLLNEKSQFYQAHLDQVSRSFSFCIAQLDQPFRAWIGLSYLLFRVLDTIEDSQWIQIEKKTQAFHQFQFLLQNPAFLDQNRPPQIQTFIESFPSTIPLSEKELISASHRLLTDFHELPFAIRTPLQRALKLMAQGMLHFQLGNGLRLKTLKQVNQYCFFVAGIIGEMLTDFAQAIDPQLKENKSLSRLGVQFGLFLQKINILKDQKEDEKEGRYLIPHRSEVIESLKRDAAGAFQYLLSLPLHLKSYRIFCGWSLFLGLYSLPWIQKSFVNFVPEKISRGLTQSLLKKVADDIQDNSKLSLLFQQATQVLGPLCSIHQWTSHHTARSQTFHLSQLDEWSLSFLQVYQTEQTVLTPAELAEIGII